MFPDLAWKVDKNGYSPLHHACISGHLEITRILLTLSTDLALQFSSTGYMPLHLAAMNAKTDIVLTKNRKQKGRANTGL